MPEFKLGQDEISSAGRRSQSLVAGLLLCSLLSGCAPTRQVIQVPKVQVEKIRLTALSLPQQGQSAKASLNLLLKVSNPNLVPVRLANIWAKLVLDGQEAGDVNLPNVSLPARGDAEQTADLVIPVTLATAAAYLKVARGQETSYRLDGKFTAEFGALGHPTFGPFTLSQGVWKQKPIIPF